MGDTTTAELVGDAVDNVDETEKSGEEEKEKTEADKKSAKEKKKTAEKKGLKRAGEEPGGGRPEEMQEMHSAPRNSGAIGMSTASRENQVWSGAWGNCSAK